MGLYTLQNLENLTGIKADTIRVWEKRYGIMKPQRTATNRRRYDDDDLRKLLNITSLYNSGYKISRIAAMKDDEINKHALMVVGLYDNIESVTGIMIPAMNDFNEAVINDIIRQAILKMGFEAAFRQVIIPVLRKVGVLWSTGSLSVGTEHFITGIIRRKLFAEIETATPLSRKKKKKFLLFLPEHELHEIGLLFYSYLIFINGHNTLYLGQSTPLKAIDDTIRIWNPDYVVTGITSEIYISEPAAFLRKLREIPGKFYILAAGLLADKAREERLSRVYPVKTEKDLLFYID